MCGYKKGRPEKSGDNRLLNQTQISQDLGISERTLREMLERDRKLTPEIKEIIDNGIITKTTATKLITKLSPQEQEELLQSLPVAEKLTQKQVQEYVESDKQNRKDIIITL